MLQKCGCNPNLDNKWLDNQGSDNQGLTVQDIYNPTCTMTSLN